MTTFKFIQTQKIWVLISIIIISIGFGLMLNRKFNHYQIMNYGIDFIGGSTIMTRIDAISELTPDQYPEFIATLRNELKTIDLENSAIQISQDKEVIIKTTSLENKAIDQVLELIQNRFGQYELLEVDFIGPSIGQELKKKSFWIVTLVSISLLAYISWRFQFAYGISALFALLHDALVTLSMASVLMIEINTAFIAAILTILGYSINDTIIIFDRIRENFTRKEYKEYSKNQIINLSLNQTLTRTINTSLTTFIVLVALILFGGTTIKEFALVLLIGILSGTYSSLFIASPILAKLIKTEEEIKTTIATE